MGLWLELSEWVFPKRGSSVMFKVTSAGFKGPPALLLLPHILPVPLALIPAEGLGHAAIAATILSSTESCEGGEGPPVIFRRGWNSPAPLTREARDGPWAAMGGTTPPTAHSVHSTPGEKLAVPQKLSRVVRSGKAQ